MTTRNNEHPIDTGRLNIIRAVSNFGYGLNIGCGRTWFPNKLNVDITTHHAIPDIIASVTHLPFKSDEFIEVILADTIEHIPSTSVNQTLSEIRRVLKDNGRIIMSAPNNTMLCKILDPIWWTRRHKHFSTAHFASILKQARFHTIMTFTSGRLPFGIVTLSYVLNFIAKRKDADMCGGIVMKSYNGIIGEAGGTLYGVAIK